MMKDYRPDLAFVVTAEVWRDFLRVREETGDALCNAFAEACVRNAQTAIRAGDTDGARHWLAVRTLGEQYGVSWVSAVEVDGELIREHPKFEVLRYPNDRDLKRVMIDNRLSPPIL